MGKGGSILHQHMETGDQGEELQLDMMTDEPDEGPQDVHTAVQDLGQGQGHDPAQGHPTSEREDVAAG